MRLALGVLRIPINNHNGGHPTGCEVRLVRALAPRAPEVQLSAGSCAAYFAYFPHYYFFYTFLLCIFCLCVTTPFLVGL